MSINQYRPSALVIGGSSPVAPDMQLQEQGNFVETQVSQVRPKNTPPSSFRQLPGLGNLPRRRDSTSAPGSGNLLPSTTEEPNYYFNPQDTEVLENLCDGIVHESFNVTPKSTRACPYAHIDESRLLSPSPTSSDGSDLLAPCPSPMSDDLRSEECFSDFDIDGEGAELLTPKSEASTAVRPALKYTLPEALATCPYSHAAKADRDCSPLEPILGHSASGEDLCHEQVIVHRAGSCEEFPEHLALRGGYLHLLLNVVIGTDSKIATICAATVALISIIVALGVSVIALAATAMVVAIVQYVSFNVKFWRDHMKPTEQKSESSTLPFLSRKLVVREHHVAEGKRVWSPKITVDDVERRAFSDLGMSLWAYLRDLFTWSLEYKIQAIWRIAMNHFKIGRYASRSATAEDIFDMTLNTTLACWIDVETGHAVFYDTILPWKQDQTKNWHKITMELDHNKKICLCMKLQQQAVPEGEPAEVLLVTNMTEIATIASQIGCLKTHVQCHWWANGVAEMGEHWSKTQQASEMVQGLNNGAVFSTGGLYMTDKMAPILGTNAVVEGFPMHGDLSLIARNSKFHKMSMLARRRLYELLPDVSKMHLEALLAASIMHSADHYYVDFYTPFVSRSTVLQTDFTLARTAFLGPNKYRTRKLLCRQHMDDPICAILYRSAVEVDRKFADEGLFFSVAN